jgi:hypothetical protein
MSGFIGHKRGTGAGGGAGETREDSRVFNLDTGHPFSAFRSSCPESEPAGRGPPGAEAPVWRAGGRSRDGRGRARGRRAAVQHWVRAGPACPPATAPRRSPGKAARSGGRGAESPARHAPDALSEVRSATSSPASTAQVHRSRGICWVAGCRLRRDGGTTWLQTVASSLGRETASTLAPALPATGRWGSRRASGSAPCTVWRHHRRCRRATASTSRATLRRRRALPGWRRGGRRERSRGGRSARRLLVVEGVHGLGQPDGT